MKIKTEIYLDIDEKNFYDYACSDYTRNRDYYADQGFETFEEYLTDSTSFELWIEREADERFYDCDYKMVIDNGDIFNLVQDELITYAIERYEQENGGQDN